MSPTAEFIARLKALDAGERSRLRRLSSQPLDGSPEGFDLFTGLWWPLREKNQRAPERRTAWLVAKLYGSFPVPHDSDDDFTFARVLGRCEQSMVGVPGDVARFRARFDALLQAPYSQIEPHLFWGMSMVRRAHGRGQVGGLNWVRLLDDLSSWTRGGDDDVREEWARHYLESTKDKHIQAQGATHVD